MIAFVRGVIASSSRSGVEAERRVDLGEARHRALGTIALTEAMKVTAGTIDLVAAGRRRARPGRTAARPCRWRSRRSAGPVSAASLRSKAATLPRKLGPS